MRNLFPAPPVRALGLALLALSTGALFAQSSNTTSPTASSSTEDNSTSTEVVVLTPFTVDATQDVGFVAASALSGGRLATSINDTPIAYSVLTREFIDALGVSDITEAAQWTTNASFAKDDGRSTQFGRVGFNDLVTFRGVPANRAQINFFPVHYDFDSFNLERFDFARGPNSILFGTGSVGGSANGFYKKAYTERKIHDLSFRVGSWDYYRATLDWNEPLTDKLAMRVNYLWQDNGTWRDGEWQKRDSGSLHLTYQPSRATTISLVGEMGKIRRSYGTTTIGDRLSTWDGTTTYATRMAGNFTPAAATGTQRIGSATAPSYIFTPGSGPNGNAVVSWSLMGMTSSSHATGSLYGESRTPVVGTNPGIVSEPLHNRLNTPADVLGAAENAGFELPGRKFSAAVDNRGYLNDYNNVIAMVDQQVGKNLFLNFAANSSEGFRGSNFATARGLKDGIQIDINQNLPTGEANPYFLEPYVQTTNDFDQVNTKSQQYRGSAALVLDDTRLGDFRFNLELGHERLENSREKYRYAIFDPLGDPRTYSSTSLISWRYYYLSEDHRPMADLGEITVIDPVAGTTRTLPTAYTLDTARPTETIHTIQRFDYGQLTANGKFFEDRLNLIAAARRDHYSTDSRIFMNRMDLPTTYNGVDVIYRPDAPSDYNSLTYTPKDANGNATGPVQEAATRPRSGSGVALAQYGGDRFKDDYSPPVVKGDTDTFSYGGMFHLTPQVSVFANYAETWSPPAANLTIYGEAFGPDVSEGWDTGLRFSFLDDRISASVIHYQGRQEGLSVSTGSIGASINAIVDANVLNDLSPTGQNVRGLGYVPRTYQDTVTRKTDGFEFEVVANVTKNWRLLANVAFANARQGDTFADTREFFAANESTMRGILSDAGVTVGANNVATVNPGVTTTNSPDSSSARDNWNSLYQTLQNATVDFQKLSRLAETTGNIFTDYTFQEGRFKNVRVGFGLNHRGKEVIGFRANDTIRDPNNPNATIDDPTVDAFTPVYRPGYTTATLMFGYSRRIFERPVRFDLRVENLFDYDNPLYYTTSMRAPGGDLSNPARVSTPSLFHYLTPRNFMLTMTVGF